MTFIDFTERLARYLHVQPKGLYRVVFGMKTHQIKAINSDIIQQFRQYRIPRDVSPSLTWYLCHKRIDTLDPKRFMEVTRLVREYVSDEYGIKLDYNLHGLAPLE